MTSVIEIIVFDLIHRGKYRLLCIVEVFRSYHVAKSMILPTVGSRECKASVAPAIPRL